MQTKAVIGGIAVALALMLPAGSASWLPGVDDVVRIYDANGELVYEQMVDPENPLLLKTMHYLRVGAVQPSEDAAKPGSGGGADPGTDCESDAYKVAGWYWTTAYSAYSTQVASIVSGALNEWDSHTSKSISGGASSGSRGTAGTYDGVNQLDWLSLGASSTIAVTTTWSYRVSGEAVESDGQYNTYYAWGSGSGNYMDYENIIQHEVGHTLGLNHPTTSSTNSCLTMYAYSDYGITAGRTLGDGDILGIKAVYGA